MVNFGPLAAEIVSLVWGTPGNFNGFGVLAALLQRHSSSGRQPNFAALNSGHTYIQQCGHHVGQLAHISSCCKYIARMFIESSSTFYIFFNNDTAVFTSMRRNFFNDDKSMFFRGRRTLLIAEVGGRDLRVGGNMVLSLHSPNEPGRLAMALSTAP